VFFSSGQVKINLLNWTLLKYSTESTELSNANKRDFIDYSREVPIEIHVEGALLQTHHILLDPEWYPESSTGKDKCT